MPVRNKRFKHRYVNAVVYSSVRNNQNGRPRPLRFPDLSDNESGGVQVQQPHRTVATASTSNSVYPQLPLPPFFQFPAVPGLVFRTSARLALLLRLEIISCRWCKAQLCPRLQGRLQQQSLAQSLLSYATESCCTVVPKHKKLDLLL